MVCRAREPPVRIERRFPISTHIIKRAPVSNAAVVSFQKKPASDSASIAQPACP